MTKIDIFSGFLGAGKTTLIKKLVKEAYAGEQIVLIENEFGEIGIDSGFLQDAGINITEMNSGCICCSLVGDFSKALKQVSAEYHPDRIVIEPSGVGKLSDVIKAVANASLEDASLNAFCTVVDAGKCKMYMKNFGEFFNDQVENAGCIILSHTDGISEEKLAACVQLLKEKNDSATIVTAPWSQLEGKAILAAMEQKDSLRASLRASLPNTRETSTNIITVMAVRKNTSITITMTAKKNTSITIIMTAKKNTSITIIMTAEGGECCCHHDHEGHEHHHHGHHHADDVFTSWGIETTHKFTKEELESALAALSDEERYGTVLRAKGIVSGTEGWLHFDYVPAEPDVRTGSAGVTGRLCVIGCKINEAALKELFKA